jgi:hypothetical protein
MHRLDVDVEGKVPILVGAVKHAAVMDEARAVEQDVDRPDLARERGDRIPERTSSLRRSASSPARPSRSMSVAATRAPSSRKGLAVARPMPAAAVSTATFPSNRPVIENAPSPSGSDLLAPARRSAPRRFATGILPKPRELA